MSDATATAGSASAAADSASATAAAAPAQTVSEQQQQSADSASNDTAAAAEDEQMNDAPAAAGTADDSNAAAAESAAAPATDAAASSSSDAAAPAAVDSSAGEMSDVPAPSDAAPSTADADSSAAAAAAAAGAGDASANTDSAASSPRNAGRPLQAVAEPAASSSAVAAAAQPDESASSSAAAASPRSSKHNIWLTAHEASVQNKKMKAHSGWKFVPVSGQRLMTAALLGAAAGVDLNAGRTARRKSGMEDVPPSPQALPQEAPAFGRGASKKAAAAAAAAAAPPTPATPTGKKGSKRKGDFSAAASIDASLDEKQRQLAALAAQIEALKNQEQSILSGATVPSTPTAAAAAAVPSAAAAASPAPAEKKRKPTPVAIPTTPSFARAPSTAATPGATPATPGLSRSGRNVKAPSHFADMESLDPIPSTTAPAHHSSSAASASSRPRSQGVHLKSCRKLLEHLAAHKASQGIFAVPVNYNDPSKQFFAPNYLEAIGPDNQPMNLGQVRSKLVNFEYATMFEFAADVRMVYRNAMLYNPEDTWIHKAAADCMRIFEREIARIEQLPERRVKEDEGYYDERDVGGGDQYGRSHHGSSSKSKKKGGSARHSELATNLPAMQQSVLEQMTARILALEAKLQQSTPIDAGAYVQPSYQAPPPVQPQYRPEREHTPVAHRPVAAERERPAPAPRKSAAPSVPKAQQPLSQHEKQSLKDDIFKLPPNKLSPVVDIISKAMPKSEQKDDSDEIEIDIDKLDIPTLRELQTYVKSALGASKRGSKPTTGPAARRPTTGGAAGPKTPAAGPGAAAARATPAAASPAAAAASSSVLSSAALQSPLRLDTPATPSMARGTSQAIGSTTPALKYDSSSDDSDSDSSSDSDDDGGNFTHLTNKSAPAAAAAAAGAAASPDDTPAPTILDADKAPTKSAGSSSDSDSDDDAAAPAWSNVAPAAIVPASTPGSAAASAPAGSSSGTGGALWSDFQRTAEETRLKRAALSELESKQKAQLEEQRASLINAGEERRRRAQEEEAAQAAAESRAAAEKATKLAADREAARRAREARAGASVEEPTPAAPAVSMMEDGVQQEEDYEHM